MANIFISYNRHNEAITKSLGEDLENSGHNVWFDNELVGGKAWWNQILEWILKCDVFAFILSQESLDSMACKRELGYAYDLGKEILPILISSEISVNLLPPELNGIQFVDYIKQDKPAILRLTRALNNIQRSRPLPDPLPAPPEIPVSYLGGYLKEIESPIGMDLNEQSALFLKLKPYYTDRETRNDTLKLLKLLRKRQDLFAIVADQIDELLFEIIKTPRALAFAIAKDISADKRSPEKEKLSPGEHINLIDKDKSQQSYVINDLKERQAPEDEHLNLEQIIIGTWSVKIANLFTSPISATFQFDSNGTFSARIFSEMGIIPVQGKWVMQLEMLTLRGNQTLAFIDYPYSADITFKNILQNRLEGTSQVGESIVMTK